MSHDVERRWADEAARLHAKLLESPPDPGEIRLEGAWRDAVAGEMRPMDTRVSLALPAACPLRAAELLAAGMDVQDAAVRIRGSAAIG